MDKDTYLAELWPFLDGEDFAGALNYIRRTWDEASRGWSRSERQQLEGGLFTYITTAAAILGQTATEQRDVPTDVSDEIEDEPGWRKPTLADFTDQPWEELEDEEKNRIASFFAWADDLPPSSFEALQFPHHDPETGDAILEGVEEAIADLEASDLAEDERAAVREHLSSHIDDAEDEGLETDESDGEQPQNAPIEQAAIDDGADRPPLDLTVDGPQVNPADSHAHVNIQIDIPTRSDPEWLKRRHDFNRRRLSDI